MRPLGSETRASGSVGLQEGIVAPRQSIGVSSEICMRAISALNKLKRKTSTTNNPVRKLCKWRDEKDTAMAITSGKIIGTAKCRHCGNYDFTCQSCIYVGKTGPDASCVFWDEAE